MDYNGVLTNAVLTKIAEFTLWLIRSGGALHVGTNRNRTSLLLKVFTPVASPQYFWYNTEDDISEYLTEVQNYIVAQVNPPKVTG